MPVTTVTYSLTGATTGSGTASIGGGGTTWNAGTLALNVGATTVTTTVTDSAGATSQDTLVVTRDNTAPNAPVISLGAYTTANYFSATGTAIDQSPDTGIASVEWSLNQSTWTACTGSSSSGTCSWSCEVNGALSVGNNTIYFRATNGAGLISTSSSAAVVYDNTNPNTPTVTNPSTNPSYGQTATPVFSGTASDASPDTGIAAIQYSLDSGTWTNISPFTPVSSGTANWSFTSPSISAGSHTFSFRSVNNAGRSSVATANQTYWYDTVIPTVTITAPTAGFVTGTSSIAMAGSSADTQSGVQKVQYKVNGGAWTDASGTAPWSATATGLTSGSNTLYAQAIDRAGRTSISASVTGTYSTGPDANTMTLLHLNNSLTDSAPSPKGWTQYGNASYMGGKFAQAVYTSGGMPVLYSSSGFVLIPLGNGNWTLEGWLYPSGGTSDVLFYGVNNSGVVVVAAYKSSASPQIQAVVGQGTGSGGYQYFTMTSNSAPYWNVNGYNHIALVRNSLTTALCFVNGYATVRESYGSIIDSNQQCNLGGYYSCTIGGYYDAYTSPYYFPMSCLVDEFRISNVARWTAPFTPPTAPY